jgi:AraC-like DNA-binding protein/mannose-6-phosphate isomerase-like protein (cupin superfamily)
MPRRKVSVAAIEAVSETVRLRSRQQLTLEIARRLLVRDYHVHTHDHTELFVVLNGSAVHMLDGRPHFIKAGDVYVLPRGGLHGFANVANLTHYNIGFYPRLLTALGDDLRRTQGFERLFGRAPRGERAAGRLATLHLSMVDLRKAESLAEAVRRECDGRRPGHEVAARARFVELAVFLCRAQTDRESPQGDGLLRLARAAHFIEENFRRPVVVDELARLAGLSPSHFARLFRRHYQVSPGAYLQSLRIQHAAWLLTESERSVSRAALESGFTDGNYFARQFRRFMAMTPRQYRERHRVPDGRRTTEVV